MDQAVGAAEVDKRAKAGQAADDAPPHVTFLQLFEQVLLLLRAPLPPRRPVREDQAVAAAVDLDDLEGQRPVQPVAKHLCPVGHVAAHADQVRGRHKAPQPAEWDQQAAAVLAGHFGLKDLAALLQLLGAGPVALHLSQIERADEVPLPVLGLDDVDRNLVALVDLRHGLGAQLLQVAALHDAFALGTDVDDDFVGLDRDHHSLAYVTTLGPLVVVLVQYGLAHARSWRLRLGWWRPFCRLGRALLTGPWLFLLLCCRIVGSEEWRLWRHALPDFQVGGPLATVFQCPKRHRCPPSEHKTGKKETRLPYLAATTRRTGSEPLKSVAA